MKPIILKLQGREGLREGMGGARESTERAGGSTVELKGHAPDKINWMESREINGLGVEPSVRKINYV